MVTVFTRPGSNPSSRKTVAGLLVLFTTVTLVVRPGLNFRVRVTTQVLKTLNRVVVFTRTSPGPETNVEKLATVLTFRKMSGGHYFRSIFRQKTPRMEPLLHSFTLSLVLVWKGTPFRTTFSLTGIRRSGLKLPPTVS